MAECVYCKCETALHDCGTPICINCSDARDAPRMPPTSQQSLLTIWRHEAATATTQTRALSEEFIKILTDVPSCIPLPEGADRLHNASRALSFARAKMKTANSRLNDFLARGIIPEDLHGADMAQPPAVQRHTKKAS